MTVVVLEAGVRLADHQTDLDSIVEKIQFVMGKECPVRFCVMDDIPTNESGKYPYAVCRYRPQMPPLDLSRS